jgi:hypothetical protein
MLHKQEGFAFSHCTTCKAPYYLRVHSHTDRKWRTLKFRFFVTRDILFIFALVQIVSFWNILFILIPYLHSIEWPVVFSYSFIQVITALAYLVHFIDGYQQYWLRTAWGFDNEVSFYYICGKLLNLYFVTSFTCFCMPHACLIKIMPGFLWYLLSPLILRTHFRFLN